MKILRRFILVSLWITAFVYFAPGVGSLDGPSGHYTRSQYDSDEFAADMYKRQNPVIYPTAMIGFCGLTLWGLYRLSKRFP